MSTKAENKLTAKKHGAKMPTITLTETRKREERTSSEVKDYQVTQEMDQEAFSWPTPQSLWNPP